jgi:hypothetical protein
MTDYIIGFIVFSAFARAAREYNKSMFLWGTIGVASFFIPLNLITFLGLALLQSAGAPDASLVLLGAAFVASVMIAIFAYNKLMSRAIQELESLDATAPATAPPHL